MTPICICYLTHYTLSTYRSCRCWEEHVNGTSSVPLRECVKEGNAQVSGCCVFIYFSVCAQLRMYIYSRLYTKGYIGVSVVCALQLCTFICRLCTSLCTSLCRLCTKGQLCILLSGPTVSMIRATIHACTICKTYQTSAHTKPTHAGHLGI